MTKMKWLGWINLYFLICGIALVAVLFEQSENISQNKIHVVEHVAQHKELPTLEQVRGEIREGFDISMLVESTDGKIARGKELYATNCASCHGQTGLGDGAPLSPPPRNFHSLEGWTNGPEISHIFKSLTEGIAGTGMSSYGTLPVEDRFALAHFVRTLAEGYPTVDDADMALLKDVYELDQDKKDQSQVSVEVAMTNLSSEQSAMVEKQKAYKNILYTYGVPQAKIIAVALSQSKNWSTSPAALASLVEEVGRTTTVAATFSLESAQWETLLAALKDAK